MERKICGICGTDLGTRFASPMIKVDGKWAHKDCIEWLEFKR